MMLHREFVEEPSPYIAADDTDDSEHAGNLEVFTEAGVDVPPSNEDETAADVGHLLKEAMSFGLHDRSAHVRFRWPCGCTIPCEG